MYECWKFQHFDYTVEPNGLGGATLRVVDRRGREVTIEFDEKATLHVGKAMMGGEPLLLLPEGMVKNGA